MKSKYENFKTSLEQLESVLENKEEQLTEEEVYKKYINEHIEEDIEGVVFLLSSLISDEII
jgi:hypothetical protein